jgi:transketolase
LQECSIDVRVFSFHTVKPLDSLILEECCESGLPVFTVEEHGLAGGLASAIYEWLSERRLSCRLTPLAAGDRFAHRSGSQNFLREQEGLTARQIASSVADVMEEAFC